MLPWQATPEERKRPLPGDDLVPEARSAPTHAITIPVPPDNVWPWLVQRGCDRAGYYSYDRLDNGGRPSADRILPAFQNTAVGDLLPSRPGSPHGFEVLRMEPPRVFLLGAFLRLPGGATLPWDGARPKAYLRATWLFLLEEQDGATRLVVRVRGITRPRWLGIMINSVMGPAHIIMQRRQLLNLRARAEAIGHAEDRQAGV